VIDRTARAEYKVEPRQFDGRPLYHLGKDANKATDLYLEIYLTNYAPENRIGLYRNGTRVLENISELEHLNKPPWNSGHLQGIIDVPYLNLTPGTRLGIIQDNSLERFFDELAPIECELQQIIENQKKAEEERASKDVLKKIQSALKEALLSLPSEEYDWFNIHALSHRPKHDPLADNNRNDVNVNSENERLPDQEQDEGEDEKARAPQLDFFDHVGPLFSVRIAPASSVTKINSERKLRAIARDKKRRQIDERLVFRWEIVEGSGTLSDIDNEIATFHAPEEPCLSRIKVTVKQDNIACEAEALITVTDSLIKESSTSSDQKQGIPGYTYQKAPGQLWRSRFDSEKNLIVINNGHRDFVFSSQNKILKLRYILRLYSKELVLKNFVGLSSDHLLERMIELTLYTEENLK
ncbi:MAG: hypothetical protein AABY86_08880, partial [Bdellovibrionota bacterium]